MFINFGEKMTNGFNKFVKGVTKFEFINKKEFKRCFIVQKVWKEKSRKEWHYIRHPF